MLVYGRYSLDEVHLVAREVESETVCLLCRCVLVSSYEYDRYVRLFCRLERLWIDLVVCRSLIYEVNCLRLVHAESEDLLLHRGAGSVNAAYRLS